MLQNRFRNHLRCIHLERDENTPPALVSIAGGVINRGMQANSSMVLGRIDGAHSDECVEISLFQNAAGLLEFVVSEQHFAEGIGWFTQRSLRLTTKQVSQLKRLLQIRTRS